MPGKRRIERPPYQRPGESGDGARYRKAAALAKLLQSESEARYDYNDYLTEFGSDMTDDEIDEIREIMSDESNHAIKLERRYAETNGVYPSPDGAVEALEDIAEGIEEGDDADE